MKIVKKIFKFIFTLLFITLIIALVGAGAGVYYLTEHEYKPEAVEDLAIYGESSKELLPGDTVDILTYNIGYGANDSKHDFFMDGGTTVTTESADNITKNMDGIINVIKDEDADVVFIQEIDIDSKRSYNIDETSLVSNAFPDDNIVFATNFLCDYIPYPVTDNVGKINSGILTINKYIVESAERRSLTNGFTWPVSTCQIKRCLLVERIPIKDSQKQLILINLHLDAYDNGEGKAAQYQELCELMQLEYAKGNYVIAGGDFNSVLPSVDKNKYPLVLTDNFEPAAISTDNLTGGWKYCTDDTVPSSRLLNEAYDPKSKNTQLYVIDGFITSPNTIVQSTETIDTGFAYSDHNPVKIKVSLVENN